MPFLSKLTIGHKLSLIGAIFALPLAFLLYSLVAEKNIAIDFARKEIAGNHLLSDLTAAQRALQRSTATRLDEIAGIGGVGPAAAGADDEAAQALARSHLYSARLALTPGPLRETQLSSQPIVAL